MGRITDLGYDADDRLTTEKWLTAGGGTTLRTTTITRDVAGRITGIVDPNSQYSYTYDNADRLLTVDDAGTTGGESMDCEVWMR